MTFMQKLKEKFNYKSKEQRIREERTQRLNEALAIAALKARIENEQQRDAIYDNEYADRLMRSLHKAKGHVPPTRMQRTIAAHPTLNRTSTYYAPYRPSGQPITSSDSVDSSASIVQAAVLYSVLSDNSQSSTSGMGSYSSDCSSVSSYDSSSYSSCDSGSSYSGGCD